MGCDVQLEVELSGGHLILKNKDNFCSRLQNVFSPGEHGGDGLRSWGMEGSPGEHGVDGLRSWGWRGVQGSTVEMA